MFFQHLKHPTFETDQLPNQNQHKVLCQFCKGHLLFQEFCEIHKQMQNRMICGKILLLYLFLLLRIFNRFNKSSSCFAAAIVANLALCLGAYSKVFKLSASITLFLLHLLIFYRNPCLVLSPNHLFSLIFVMKSGNSKLLLISSLGQFSYTPFAT